MDRQARVSMRRQSVAFTFGMAANHVRTHLQSGLKSQETITSYLTAVAQASAFLLGLGESGRAACRT